MIYRTSNEKIDEYYSSTAMNQSAIKAILIQGMQTFINKQEEIKKEEEYFAEDAEHFIIGKAVDCIITEGEESFLNRYHFNGLSKKPSDKAMLVVRKLYDKFVLKGESPEGYPDYQVQQGDPIALFARDLYDAMNTIVDKDGAVGYYLNLKVPKDNTKKGEVDTRSWMEDTRATKMLLADGTCEAYWQDLLASQGKKVLSQMQYEISRTVANNLLTHKFTTGLFNPVLYETNESVDVLYQTILEWEEVVEILVNGEFVEVEVYCKCMLDYIRVNHEKQKITPVDIKTTGRAVTEYNKEIKKRRGDIQASFYTRGIQMCLTKLAEIVGRDISTYRIMPFAFAVESTTSPGIPLIYPVSWELMRLARTGNDEQDGWITALKKYASYRAYGFSVERMLEGKNGIVMVDHEYRTDLPI